MSVFSDRDARSKLFASNQHQRRSRSVALANRHNFPMIACFDLRSRLSVVNLITASGKFLFANCLCRFNFEKIQV